MVDNKTRQVICTDFSNDKKHDFRLFKKSKILIHPKVKAITDTGYQGIQKIHNNSELPKKKCKKNPLTKLVLLFYLINAVCVNLNTITDIFITTFINLKLK
ncbi:IS5 family transposase ISOt6 [Orientia tsutsugamushi]|uniref:IS5 family transposase ISOt6 n=1 Tax=Orientia tsutsugamushi TaxID=784 RepID=A0A2U3RNJ6_ORITS|nr:putative transposase [Orientia tsutsugamushi str. Karp]SPR14813.1 IS5 family transposase ISOt6 [Orientia tsutsugamushi]